MALTPSRRCHILAQIPLSEAGRLERLEHLVRLFNRGDMPRVDWLDSLTMAVGRIVEWDGRGVRRVGMIYNPSEMG